MLLLAGVVVVLTRRFDSDHFNHWIAVESFFIISVDRDGHPRLGGAIVVTVVIVIVIPRLNK